MRNRLLAFHRDFSVRDVRDLAEFVEMAVFRFDDADEFVRLEYVSGKRLFLRFSQRVEVYHELATNERASRARFHAILILRNGHSE